MLGKSCVSCSCFESHGWVRWKLLEPLVCVAAWPKCLWLVECCSNASERWKSIGRNFCRWLDLLGFFYWLEVIGGILIGWNLIGSIRLMLQRILKSVQQGQSSSKPPGNRLYVVLEGHRKRGLTIEAEIRPENSAQKFGANFDGMHAVKIACMNACLLECCLNDGNCWLGCLNDGMRLVTAACMLR